MIADSHGLVDIESIKCLYPIFDYLIIHVMTGSGWLENIENEVINVLNQD